MTWLITSDLHLTDRPEHAYRLEFLEWLVTEAEKHTQCFILGDISDQKDRHSGVLVNAIAYQINRLASRIPVHILYGNHDGPSPDRAFWQFLELIPDVYYYRGATAQLIDKFDVIFSPWGTEIDGIQLAIKAKITGKGMMFMHATVNGAEVENGTKLQGGCPSNFVPNHLKNYLKVFSGDVHVPQIVGDVEYVGSPYHVHYGDSFRPRVAAIDPLTWVRSDTSFKGGPRLRTLRVRWNVEIPFKHQEGDRYKIIVQAEEEVLPQDWHAFVKTTRAQLETIGGTLHGITLERHRTDGTVAAPSLRRSDESIVRTYSERQKYNEETTTEGLRLLKMTAHETGGDAK